MVGNFINLCTASELRRIIDAPIEDWCTIEPIDDLSRCCLLGHACGLGHRDELTTHLWMAFINDERFEALPVEQLESIGFHFDSLVERFSLPRVVRAIKIRALRRLELVRDLPPAFARDA